MRWRGVKRRKKKLIQQYEGIYPCRVTAGGGGAYTIGFFRNDINNQEIKLKIYTYANRSGKTVTGQLAAYRLSDNFSS